MNWHFKNGSTIEPTQLHSKIKGMKRYKITTKDGQAFCGVYPRQIDGLLQIAVGDHRRTDEGFVYTDAGLVACVEVEGGE